MTGRSPQDPNANNNNSNIHNSNITDNSDNTILIIIMVFIIVILLRIVIVIIIIMMVLIGCRPWSPEPYAYSRLNKFLPLASLFYPKLGRPPGHLIFSLMALIRDPVY